MQNGIKQNNRVFENYWFAALGTPPESEARQIRARIGREPFRTGILVGTPQSRLPNGNQSSQGRPCFTTNWNG